MPANKAARLPTMNTLSERVVYILNHTDLSPSEIARRIGCKPQSISQWKNGNTANLKNDLLFAFSDVTGFEARWIATGRGPQRMEDSEKERALLDLFRHTDDRGRDTIIRVAQAERAPYLVTPERLSKTGSQ